ncbi:hypothetical protein GCM10008174_27940 [Methylopila turkensis]|uniref:Uncharacterized protein n=1 Tax=Methylopila turkensis TaxID=1437816 RepID=A0A9W6JT16_9HYPH|nr:hypothetical protein GCM10008174_27940 [Methylopila turkensis]
MWRAWCKLLAGFATAMIGFAGVAAHAQVIEPTIYSDGASCPANCDSHVVLHSSRNGTAYASAPSSSRANPSRCVTGQPCRVCFSESDASCIVATYRGSGPPPNKFDFTPAFYEENCAKPSLPEALRRKCDSFQRTLDRRLRGNVYCVASPQHGACRPIIARAEAAKAQDRPLWDACRRDGEAAFNRAHRNEPNKQRSEACAYERRGTGGPNSAGVTWRRLKPAVCQSGSYVGRDGLDCCDSNLMSLGGLDLECTPFLAPR